jgi:hypothetical protein
VQENFSYRRAIRRACRIRAKAPMCFDNIAVRSGHTIIQWMSVPLVVKLSIDAMVV